MLLRFNSIFEIFYQTERVKSPHGVRDLWYVSSGNTEDILTSIFCQSFYIFQISENLTLQFTKQKEIWILKYETAEVRSGEERSKAKWWSRPCCWSWWWQWCPAWPVRRSGASLGCIEIPTHQSSWRGTISVPRGKREFLLRFTYH